MLILFILSLFFTLILVRTLAYFFQDMKNYGTKHEKSRTITGWLRIKTGFDWHHFHLGILILIILLPFIKLFGLTKINIIFLAIGISMIADQVVSIINRKANYFYIKNLLISISFHIIISLIAILIYLLE